MIVFECDYIQQFETIKAAVEGGRDINELEQGCSMLNNYLDCYYLHHRGDDDDEARKDYVPIDGFVEETRMPLNQRPSLVLCHLRWLLSQGADPNAGDEDFPLMRAVGNLDAHMTDFLICSGANAHWDLDDGIQFGCGNWYVDELDVIALDESFANDRDVKVFDAILATAQVLARHGVRDVHTHCVSIDDDGTVTVEKARVLF